MAKRGQRFPIGACKVIAQHDWCFEGFRCCLEAADQIYRGPYDGEIESLSGADVAVNHCTDVQRYDDLKRRFVHHRRFAVELANSSKRFLRRLERTCCGSIRRGAVVDREYRQQTVAHEFQDLSAMAVDCLRLHIEQRIKYPDYLIARQPVRTLGEPTQVRGPQHSCEFLSGSPPDLAGQHPRTGLWAKIGVEYIGGNPPLTVYVAQDCHALRDSRHIGNLIRRDLRPWMLRIGKHVVTIAAMDAGDRQGQIVRRTPSFQFREHREIERRPSTLQASSQRLA